MRPCWKLGETMTPRNPKARRPACQQNASGGFLSLCCSCHGIDLCSVPYTRPGAWSQAALAYHLNGPGDNGWSVDMSDEIRKRWASLFQVLCVPSMCRGLPRFRAQSSSQGFCLSNYCCCSIVQAFAVLMLAICPSNLSFAHVVAPLPQDELGDRPAILHEPACCAEFLVSRERVLARPLEFYQAALNIIHVSCASSCPRT